MTTSSTIAWPKPWNLWFRPEDVPLPKACCCVGLGYYRMNAPVGHPLFGKGFPCVCKTNQIERNRAEELRHWSGMGKQQLLSLTFSAFQPECCVPPSDSHVPKATIVNEMVKVKKLCQDYAKNPDGWLVLWGKVGCGKTHLACAIINEVLAAGHGAHFNSVAGMLDLLRSSYEFGAFDTWFKRLQGVAVLALDDLGAERGTDWSREKLFELIDYRYMNRLPLVVTTNLSLTDERIQLRLRSRLQEGSRIRQGWSRVLPLPAGDIRLMREWVGNT